MIYERHFGSVLSSINVTSLLVRLKVGMLRSTSVGQCFIELYDIGGPRYIFSAANTLALVSVSFMVTGCRAMNVPS